MNACRRSGVRVSAPALGALLLTLPALYCDASDASSNPTATPAVHVITIEGMQFRPASLTVTHGDRITWVNKDLFPHTATGPKGTFDSTIIPAGASWSLVARTSGAFAYTCTFHPTMKATLTVR